MYGEYFAYMNKLTAWILSIAGVALLGVLLDLIVAEGRTQTYIKSIFGIIAVVIIASPLAGLAKGDWQLDFNYCCYTYYYFWCYLYCWKLV